MPITHSVFDLFFLLSVSITWIMIVYQLGLTIAGYRYRQQIFAEQQFMRLLEFPPAPVSILIPAHNEGLVIEKTLQRVASLDYPREHIEIVVVNDASTDNTATLVKKMAKKDSRIVLVDVAGTDGHGKAYALNLGLTYCSHEIIAVYDADNQPQRDSLKILIPYLQNDSSLAAVVGKFRTLNRRKNWLTRFINIETMAFQWILQAGRYFTSGVTILPGTNYVIKKQFLIENGGWDVHAITEDAELTVRIYEQGYRIKFVPLSVTWEQEPEKLPVWTKQRTRWIRGNNYVIKKFTSNIFNGKSRFLLTEFFYFFAFYYLFLIAIFISHVLFLLSLTGLVALGIPGPYFWVWISAYLLFVIEIAIVLSYEKEDSFSNLGCAALMYFTYCQLWLFIVFKSFVTDMRRHRVGVWDKTDRYQLVESIQIEEDI